MIEDSHEEILNATFLGLLSTIRHSDGRISTNPVSYVWTGEELEISTIKSRVKYKNLLANPQATFCVVSPTNHMHYVEIRGTARLVDDADKAIFREAFRKNAGEYPPEDLDPPGAERVAIYIKPEQVSSPVMYGGRFDDRGEHGTET